MTMSTLPIKLIDLCTVVVVVAFAYYFREGLLSKTFTWELAVLTALGFVLGLTYYSRGDALCTSNRTQIFFGITYAAMIVPAIINADGWTIVFAWFAYGPMGVPIALAMYFGWGLPILLGGKVPVS